MLCRTLESSLSVIQGMVYLLKLVFCLNIFARTEEKCQNDAATISDNVSNSNKMTLVKPALQRVGDNITMLKDRQLFNNMYKSALIMLDKFSRSKGKQTKNMKIVFTLNLDFCVFMFGILP